MFLSRREYNCPHRRGKKILAWWTQGDSDSWPPRCKRGALPTELWALRKTQGEPKTYCKSTKPITPLIKRGSHRIKLLNLSGKQDLSPASRNWSYLDNRDLAKGGCIDLPRSDRGLVRNSYHELILFPRKVETILSPPRMLVNPQTSYIILAWHLRKK